jgi:large subunit ribosomal protein L5
MDICVTINRPGDRVADRRKRKAKVGKKQVLTPEESIFFTKQLLGVEIV